GNSGSYQNSGGQLRTNNRHQSIPSMAPFTAYIGNLPDNVVQGDFDERLFNGLRVKQVRLVRDRETDRFRGMNCFT
ncbi:unnamed protein product, partial [Didymodactylos carnosus]